MVIVQVTQKAEIMFLIANSLAHTKWVCRYHIVFTPKYRRKIIYNELRKDIREIIRDLCKRKGVEIIEGNMMADHVQILVSIPPKMSASSFMGYLKAKSAMIIFERHANLKYKFKRLPKKKKYDGYYAVATNLLDSAIDILAVSHKRYQIEDCFRMMKTSFDGRPVNHRLPERIKAYFLICYTALLVYRLMEVKLDEQNTHVTANGFITTLKNMNVANIHDVEYMALYDGSQALDALIRLTLLPLVFTYNIFHSSKKL